MEQYVEPGIVVWTDAFSPYNDYSMGGYFIQFVNHSENLVNPLSGIRTQAIERAWLDAKSWNHCSRGNFVYLQSHLNETAWRKLWTPSHRCVTLFGVSLNNMKEIFTSLYWSKRSCTHCSTVEMKYYSLNI